MSSYTKKDANQQTRNDAANSPRFLLSSTLHRTWNTSDFSTIGRAILGPYYTLSVVLVGDVRAKKLNEQYRGKSTPANVLSFPLSKNSGEIFINIPRVIREAHMYGLTPRQHSRFLFIHGCLHLRGYAHGSTMERAEEKYMKAFVLRCT